ncbi:MAG: GbsR/MarR family transcriptional regulator [Candidatus Limnocylindria bacterium]
MSSTFASAPSVSAAEELRRSFAIAWGSIGAAWGVAPSTAAVQGYLLVADGAQSEPEVRRALGMSHRATSLALAQCEEWGLIERAEAPRRSGQRGPAAVAWTVVDDHWEWFRRVAAARKQRETDPVLPVIERCAAEARTSAGADDDPTDEMNRLGARLSSLLGFVRRFDRGVELFVRGDARSIESLFATLEGLEPETVDRLWALIAELGTEDLSRVIDALARIPPENARRLIGLADQPMLQKLIGLR